MANQFIGRSWQPINKEIKKETHHIDTTKPLILGCIWEAILKSLEGHWETQASHFAARVIIWRKKIPITKKWDPGISRFLCKRVIFVSHIEDQCNVGWLWWEQHLSKWIPDDVDDLPEQVGSRSHVEHLVISLRSRHWEQVPGQESNDVFWGLLKIKPYIFFSSENLRQLNITKWI